MTRIPIARTTPPSGLAAYNVDIIEAPSRNGTFVACCRETGTTVTSRDPEYDICRELKRHGFADGDLLTWRGTMPALRFKSIHKAAGYRITLGEQFPARVKRDTGEAASTLRGNLPALAEASIVHGNIETCGYPSPQEAPPACEGRCASRGVAAC